MKNTLFYLLAITCAFILGAFSVLGVDALRQQGASGTSSITQVIPTPGLGSLDGSGEDSAESASAFSRQQPITATDIPTSFAEAVNLAAPAVVTIYTSRIERHSNPSPFFSLPFNNPFGNNNNPFGDNPFFEDFFGPNTRDPEDSSTLHSLGSGVIIDESGLIVTNHHVTSYADSIFIALPSGRYSKASIVGGDPETDLVLLQAEDSAEWPVISFGDDSDIQVGDWVLAIGNPYSVGQTVTQGIISALGRDNVGVTTYENFIQTDAAINPGNSGGALIDVEGKLLGINTAIFSRSGGSLGIGFAIPVSTVLKVIGQIKSDGKVSRGWMGLYLRDVYPETAEAKAPFNDTDIFVAGVYEGSPADQSGMLSGDQIISVDGISFKNSRVLSNYVADQIPATDILLDVRRGEESLSVIIKLGTRPPQEAQ